MTLSLDTQTGFGEIHYTIDESEPTIGSAIFNRAVTLPMPVTVKAATFAEGRRISDVHIRSYDRLSIRERSSFALESCDPNGYIANVEDDAPLIGGPRAVFRLDLLNPCWIYKDADLSNISSLSAKVGQIPFNFRMDSTVLNSIQAPMSSPGVLEVRLDACVGDPIATFSLDVAQDNDAVTTLENSPLAQISGVHDLCYQFSQRSQDQVWTLQSVGLVPKRISK